MTIMDAIGAHSSKFLLHRKVHLQNALLTPPKTHVRGWSLCSRIAVHVSELRLGNVTQVSKTTRS